jgi:hypothetical protein
MRKSVDGPPKAEAKSSAVPSYQQMKKQLGGGSSKKVEEGFYPADPEGPPPVVSYYKAESKGALPLVNNWVSDAKGPESAGSAEQKNDAFSDSEAAQRSDSGSFKSDGEFSDSDDSVSPRQSGARSR